jgi:hypothetical protein
VHEDQVEYEARCPLVFIGQIFRQFSVPFPPRSVRRNQLPESEPSALTFMIAITVRPLTA